MTGAEALAAFLRASALVKEGRYDEAVRVPMLESDCAVIAAKIERAKNAPRANRTKEKT